MLANSLGNKLHGEHLILNHEINQLLGVTSNREELDIMLHDKCTETFVRSNTYSVASFHQSLCKGDKRLLQQQ
jgi:hypothetical protein